MRDAPDSKTQGERCGRLSAAEIDQLAAQAFGRLKSAILAVSGGSDSMTLLVLAEAWRDAGHSTPFIVATVDHGLRPDAAREAAWVAAQAKKAGFSHRVLKWEGEKPLSGIQEAARNARFGLLASLVSAEGLPSPAGIVLAHHLVDQAETFLMRLKRGSGLDGLAAIPELRELSGQDGIVAVRPLLGVPKQRLVATLRAMNCEWLEDPSNENTAFERVRVRKALAVLERLGIGAAEIGLSARRLARARTALESATADMMRRHLDLHAGAFGEIAASAFDDAGAELQLRLVQRLIAMFGAPGERPRMVRMEALAERLASSIGTGTLAGCRVSRGNGVIQAIREPGRRGLPEIDLEPGQSALWDGRFVVSASAGRSRAVQVRSMSSAELASLRRALADRGARSPLAIPRAAALTLPSFWEEDRLLGVCHPALGPAFSGALEGLGAEFKRSP